MKIGIFSTDFRRMSRFQISRKSVQWVPSCSMRDGQTDRHYEASGRFSQFCEKRLRKKKRRNWNTNKPAKERWTENEKASFKRWCKLASCVSGNMLKQNGIKHGLVALYDMQDGWDNAGVCDMQGTGNAAVRAWSPFSFASGRYWLDG